MKLRFLKLNIALESSFLRRLLFRCNQTCYCVGMVSVAPASRYQSRHSMYILGLIPRNWPRQFRLMVMVICGFRYQQWSHEGLKFQIYSDL